MKLRIFIPILAILIQTISGCNQSAPNASIAGALPSSYDYALVLHGGAGNMNFQNVPEENQERFKHSLDSALQLGLDVLKKGGASIDAVETVIRCLEDNPLFNAGKGAVFTSEGKNELDASIMTGWDLNAGAVAGVTNIKNPITAARAVMEKSEHVMLAGHGAEVFAAQEGLEIVDLAPLYPEHTELGGRLAGEDIHSIFARHRFESVGNIGGQLIE